MSVADLLEQQLQLKHSINRSLSNFKKTRKQNLTPAKVRNRISALKDVWIQMRNGHAALAKVAGDEVYQRVLQRGRPRRDGGGLPNRARLHGGVPRGVRTTSITELSDGLSQSMSLQEANNETANTDAEEGNHEKQVFFTSRQTLSWIQDSFFTALLSNRIDSHKDESGALFIDRDPKLFSIILNYLRAKDIDLKTVDIHTLRHEAEYYGITPLVKRLMLCKDLTQSSCDDVLFYGYLPPPNIPLQEPIAITSNVSEVTVHARIGATANSRTDGSSNGWVLASCGDQQLHESESHCYRRGSRHVQMGSQLSFNSFFPSCLSVAAEMVIRPGDVNSRLLSS